MIPGIPEGIFASRKLAGGNMLPPRDPDEDEEEEDEDEDELDEEPAVIREPDQDE
jgi:hypothetical protein